MRWVALVAVGFLLAGCTGGKAPAHAGASADSATTGVLRGLVVDEAVRPLAAVTVLVQTNAGPMNATTGSDGLFRFDGLAPGEYLIRVNKTFYAPAQSSVDVHAGVLDPPLVKLQLTFEARSVPYAAVYKTEGFHECGTNVFRICSNVNILTWIVLCTDSNQVVCLGNVTQDRSLFLVPIDGVPTFLQSELSWSATLDTGRSLSLLIGGANYTELQQGMGPAFNGTEGESPLMTRISNHEPADTWCVRHKQPCTAPDVLNSSKIGRERSLLVQVDAGGTYSAPVPGCDTLGACGAGFSAQQPFTLFTTVFYGYEPPVDWLFTTNGQTPPPPA